MGTYQDIVLRSFCRRSAVMPPPVLLEALEKSEFLTQLSSIIPTNLPVSHPAPEGGQ